MKRTAMIFLLATATWCRGEPAAVVLRYSGEVNCRVAATSTWVRVEQTNLPLEVGAELGTSTNAEAILKLGSANIVTVRELSWLRIEHAGEDDSLVSVGMGRVLLNVLRKSDKSSHKVVTPAAIAAVRGTVFGVESDAQRNTLIGVADGRVDVTGQVEGSRTVTVEKGQMVLVVFNQPPQDPRPAEMKLLEEMKGFRENLESLALIGGGLGAAATEIAEQNMRELQEAGKMLEEQRLQKKGAEKSRVDLPTLRKAFIQCVADTGYVPPVDDKNFDENTSQLARMLIEGQTADGKPIAGWKGPYIEGNLKDPFGRYYKVRYAENPKGEGRFEIYSLGQDPAQMDDDPIPQMIRLDKLAGPDGNPLAKPQR